MDEERGAELWVVMSCSAFVEHMRRAQLGEDPDLLMVEFFANGDSELVDGDDAE